MKNLEEKKYWIWLSLVKKLGSKRKQKLLEIYKTPENIFKLKKEDLLSIKGIEEIADYIVDDKIKFETNKHIDYMIKNNIDIVNITDKEYPQLLKEIYDPPISLYIKGNKEILNDNSIAIIGCRQATEYGKMAAKYFAYNLSKEGINIVSGLAKGIDSYAHIGAICGNGKTIAVVGTRIRYNISKRK